jgi:hypothetical protein
VLPGALVDDSGTLVDQLGRGEERRRVSGRPWAAVAQRPAGRSLSVNVPIKPEFRRQAPRPLELDPEHLLELGSPVAMTGHTLRAWTAGKS